MEERTLTPPERTGEDRRARRLRIGALLMMLATPSAAHAEEPPVGRALHRAALDRVEPLEARAWRATLVPRLRIGAQLRRPIAPGGRSGWELSALLTWPLERPRPVDDFGASVLVVERRRALVDRVVALWRLRAEAAAAGDPLALEELDAELEALTGPPAGADR